MENKTIIKIALKTVIYDLEKSIKELKTFTSITNKTKRNLKEHYKHEISEYKRVLEELK